MNDKKFTPQVFSLNLAPYGVRIAFSINQESPEFMKMYKRLYPGCTKEHYEEVESGLYTAYTYIPDAIGRGKIILIQLDHFKYSPLCMNSLSHEIFHAVDNILRAMGIRLSEDSEEAYAYAIGYTTEQFWKLVK